MAHNEEEILKFWEENDIFKKSLEKKSPKGEYVFYEGPPTANGKPGIHHLEARAFKDLMPRYKTMQGFHVRRKGGWDTHGLPVELQVEKQLGLKSKKEIEKFGIAEFNKKCKESVWEYVDLWEKFTKRIAFWVDLKNPYITYKNEYIESLWNVLKKVNNQKLLYKDYKIVPWCPRCGTALSSHELAQGYETVKDLSVYAKFKIKAFPDAYFLAWTTTPWTLPGNVALAVGKDIVYVEIKIGGEMLVLAKDRLSVIEGEYEIVAEHKGSEMIGMEYEPLYKFFPENTPNLDKAFKIYEADFVNTEDGTGIVHTAVMYGQDDFVLGTQVGLPKYHLVKDDGHFLEDMDFLSGRFVKDEEVAVDIIKDLAHRNLLFKKEKYEHTYPHCWRCKTPLLYYARDSWYIKMSGLRDKLVKENEKINWEPKHIREGRFGEWLREVKDWAISRERYWGTPLPVWLNSEGEFEVVGSIEELKEKTEKSGNRYFGMRHGESEHNLTDVCSSVAEYEHHLTEKGRKEVGDFAKSLTKEKITKIISSPFLRTRETAEIVAEALGIPKEEIVIDERIREYGFGEFHLKSMDEYWKWRNENQNITSAPNGGESILDAKKRVGEFIYDLESKYKNENILFISHGIVFEMLPSVIAGGDAVFTWDTYRGGSARLSFGELREYKFVPIPHNENYELDLHKPYIDEVELVNKEGEKLKRVKEVMDVWFDSGAMPFAQDGINAESQYPADFISEAIDQTRGWFYTLHAVGVLMEKGRAYKNVICLGHILDAEGKKMSKSLGNIVDPWVMIEKYGVDALRLWMYSVNQPGDSKNFDEKTVDELVKKIFNIIENILSFYLMYKDDSILKEVKSENVLDKWIVSRLNELLKQGTDYLDNYKIFEASRLIRDFANDFSTWYLRRSRERFKSEDTKEREAALYTTKTVLLGLAKYMAPFTPFFAEYIYRSLKSGEDQESVHLCGWEEGGKIDKEVLEKMEEVRRIVSLALEKRMTANIKVRQPLASLKVKSEKLKGKEEYLDLIKDEVNVKKVTVDEKLNGEVELDTEITESLKKEGIVREIIRAVQDLRKEASLTPDQQIILVVETEVQGEEFIKSNIEEIKKPTNITEIKFENVEGKKLQFDFVCTISIKLKQ